MINMIPFLVLFLLAVLGKSEGRGFGTVFVDTILVVILTGIRLSVCRSGFVYCDNK